MMIKGPTQSDIDTKWLDLLEKEIIPAIKEAISYTIFASVILI